jgi:hypothetical protein
MNAQNVRKKEKKVKKEKGRFSINEYKSHSGNPP